MDRQEYVNERKVLLDIETEAVRGFDKTLLVLSSGALLLSMNFLASKISLTFLGFLIAAWVFWILSTLSQLTSYIVTTKAIREEMKILNEQYKNYEKDARLNQYEGIASKISTTSFITFILGIASFFIFVIKNLI